MLMITIFLQFHSNNKTFKLSPQWTSGATHLYSLQIKSHPLKSNCALSLLNFKYTCSKSEKKKKLSHTTRMVCTSNTFLKYFLLPYIVFKYQIHSYCQIFIINDKVLKTSFLNSLKWALTSNTIKIIYKLFISDMAI